MRSAYAGLIVSILGLILVQLSTSIVGLVSAVVVMCIGWSIMIWGP